jgi:AraC-like DNA-binding protein
MSILISTDHLPPGDRFEFWREVMVRSWLTPVESYTRDAPRFAGWLRRSDLGAVHLGLIGTTHLESRRTPRLIRQSAQDLLKLTLSLDGHGGIAQADRTAHCAPGEFALYDTTRPYRARNVWWGSCLNLLFPRALLPLAPDQVRRLAAVPMLARQGVGALTSQFLVHLARNLDHLSPTEAARLSTAALDVLAARLAHELDGEDRLPAETRRRALLARIHAFIQTHLGDPELSPGMIAAAHYISTRYLHKLFQEQGLTVSGWIRQRRLERARRDLGDPALASRPVTAIGRRWGLPNPGHFSHVFKRAYGVTPREFRHDALRSDGNHARIVKDRALASEDSLALLGGD